MALPRWLFWPLGAGCIVIAPLFSARHLPFIDLPEHAAVSAALAHIDDPTWRIREYFTFEPASTPYWLYDAVGALLTRVTGDAILAHTLMLALVGLLFPLAASSLCIAMKKDPRLGALGAAAFWNRALQYGLLPFMSSVPVLLFALAGMVMIARGRGSRSIVVATTMLACMLPLLHVVSFTVWLVASLPLLFVFRRARGGSWRWPQLAPLFATTIFLYYLVSAHASGAIGTELRFSSVSHALTALPAWSFDVWARRDEKVCAAIYWLGYLGVFVTGVRRRERAFVVRALPLVAVLLLLFLFPTQIGVGLMLNLRLAPLLSLTLLPLVRFDRLRRPRLARASMVLALVGTAGQSLVAADVIRSSQSTLAGFDAIVDAVPTGGKVIFLPFEMEGGDARFYPWLHVAGLIRAEKGGLSQYSFTSLPHWPLHDHVSPRKGSALLWDRRPCYFEPEIDGAFYDAILVRGAYDPFIAKSETARHAVGEDFVLTVKAPPFYLWQRVDHTTHPSTTGLLPSPCDTWGPPTK